MKDLYHCAACGFLSTWLPAFERRDGKEYCKSCCEEYDTEKARAEGE